MTITKERVLAAFEVVVATGQTIRELGSVPSGELYARVMDKLSIEAYGNIIATLETGWDGGGIRQGSLVVVAGQNFRYRHMPVVHAPIALFSTSRNWIMRASFFSCGSP